VTLPLGNVTVADRRGPKRARD